jgi:glycosyltransferase involved in cell wall biosynthesis
LVEHPLISIICLCYNQAAFVEEAIASVWAQSYPAIELIVVDDGSTDASVDKIRQLLQHKPEVRFLELKENLGNCRAFNRGLQCSKGKYIIDLAADDVLLPERVAEGVKALEAAGETFAVHFTDALYINLEGRPLKQHYSHDDRGVLIEKVPQGWVYADVLQRYFICTPTMMMRRSVLEALGGYDELLAYEDFDFWVRSARDWQYCFTDQVLVKKRIVPYSWSSRQYERKSRQLESTLRVCLKAQQLNRSAAEDKALAKRLAYEIRQAIRFKQFDTAGQMLNLKSEVVPEKWLDLPYLLLIFMGRRFYR